MQKCFPCVRPIICDIPNICVVAFCMTLRIIRHMFCDDHIGSMNDAKKKNTCVSQFYQFMQSRSNTSFQGQKSLDIQMSSGLEILSSLNCEIKNTTSLRVIFPCNTWPTISLIVNAKKKLTKRTYPWWISYHYPHNDRVHYQYFLNYVNCAYAQNQINIYDGRSLQWTNFVFKRLKTYEFHLSILLRLFLFIATPHFSWFDSSKKKRSTFLRIGKVRFKYLLFRFVSVLRISLKDERNRLENVKLRHIRRWENINNVLSKEL